MSAEDHVGSALGIVSERVGVGRIPFPRHEAPEHLAAGGNHAVHAADPFGSLGMRSLGAQSRTVVSFATRSSDGPCRPFSSIVMCAGEQPTRRASPVTDRHASMRSLRSLRGSRVKSLWPSGFLTTG